MTADPGPHYRRPDSEPGPATLVVRQAVRAWLRQYPQVNDQPILCGCSGGADSFALLLAVHHAGVDVRAVVVDHQLQAGSDTVALRTVDICEQLGVSAVVVPVFPTSDSEAAARHARYAALGHQAAQGAAQGAAHQAQAAPATVVVGHTLNDQAETFLMGLARSAGTRSLAGMRPLTTDHPVVTAGAAALGRPILTVSRDDTLASCHEQGITPWQDPWNTSDAYLRVRVRQQVLPQLEQSLSPTILQTCARSATLLAQDCDALDQIAAERLEDVVGTKESHPDEQSPHVVSSLPIDAVIQQPPAISQRMLRLWLCPWTGELTQNHYQQILALVFQWHGQGGVAVPWPKIKARPGPQAGHRLQVRRRGRHLLLQAPQ